MPKISHADPTGRIKPETIITSHLNADFDAMASAFAAAKLYPDSVIVLPGSAERGLREYLFGRGESLIPYAKLKDVDLSDVKRLVVVDTRQKSRLGALSSLLDKPGVEVHLYDHHPGSSDDITGDEIFFKSLGANTTLMVQLLREKNIELSSEEATLLALGIYEDTGSFTFTSTTSEDLEAAAWLLSKGADLRIISEIISHRLTPEHIELLQDMLHNAVKYTMAGVPITVAKTSTPDYVEDFALLVHELMDMEKLPVLFAMALMADQVLIVGRSRDAKVDVSSVLKQLGGGGHPMAASATLKGITLAEAEEKLLSVLHKILGPEPKVRDIMSHPVLFVSPQTPLFEVHDQLTRYGITVLPVVDNDKVQGLISRRTVEKALYHGLGRLPVSEYMTTEFQVVHPDDTFSKVQELIVSKRQRFVPVVENDKIVGVITRTDILQILTNDASRRPEPLIPQKEQRKNISFLLKERLPDHVLEILTKAGQTADRLEVQVYIIGGFVRDLLLRRKNFDIDLVVEGEGIPFARELAKTFGARVREHKKFGTAVLIFPDGFKLDIATARWEYYEYPAAMPTVALSSVKLDLYRRDFTINTLAIKLNEKEFGTLIDFFGGQRDLKDRTIRVLHSLSFVEDPTRVFRAVRFEQRYGFKIGRHTLRLIKNALKLNIFARLSGKRLATELRLILDEPDPRPAIKRLAELDLLRVIHPQMAITPKTDEFLTRTYDVLAWYDLLYKDERPQRWIVYLCGLVSEMKDKEVEGLTNRLALTGWKRDMFIKDLKEGRKALALLSGQSSVKSSQVYRLLKGLELEIILHLLAIAKSEASRHAISRYITELKELRPQLTGHDLKKMGYKPGPVFNKILQRVLEARLDGEVKDKEDEKALVKKEFPLNAQE